MKSELVQAYLNFIANRYLYVDLKGIGMLNQPRHLKLLEMYVPLAIRPYLTEHDAWSHLPEEQESAHSPTPILPLIAQSDGLVLLGAPGAGKTTFLKYVALSLATGRMDVAGLNGRVPLIMPISAFADQLQKQKISLKSFLVQFWQTAGVDLPLDELFGTVLKEGNALLLLDGLDEVRDLRLRHEVVEQIHTFFAFHQPAGNKLVVTSRLVGYGESRLILNGVLECVLSEFNQANIATYIEHWTEAADKLEPRQLDREQAQWQQIMAQDAVLQSLATNPLLLTIMILMRRQGVALPQRRVALYDLYVRILIQDWNYTRSAGSNRPFETAETMRMLSLLALWMEESSPGVGSAQTEDVRRQLEAICRYRRMVNPETAANQFLDHILTYSGIVTSSSGGQISFLHRSFQEYMAAWAVAQRGQSTLEPVEQFIRQHVHDAGWWELIRLAVGVLGVVQQREEAATILLRRLIEMDNEYGGAAIALVGNILQDIGSASVMPEHYELFLQTLEASTTAVDTVQPQWRMSIGRSLGRLGERLTAVDQLTLCYVPPGPFIFGQPPYEEQVDFLTDGYWISQCTITNRQFAQFVAENGYSQAEFWQKATAVNRWRSGETMDWERFGWRKRPFDYGDPFNIANHPVVGISWYEADAFVQWLTQRWRQLGLIDSATSLSLPTEVQWEKAARGGLSIPSAPLTVPASELPNQQVIAVEMISNEKEKRPYPWGAELPVGKANYRHEPRGDFEEATNYAHCFPLGVSPYGCLDMCGNVWEWTRSLHLPFPYAPNKDERELNDIKLFHTVALRGGAFWNDDDQLGVVARIGRSPNGRSDSYSFRICVSGSNPPQ